MIVVADPIVNVVVVSVVANSALVISVGISHDVEVMVPVAPANVNLDVVATQVASSVDPAQSVTITVVVDGGQVMSGTTELVIVNVLFSIVVVVG